MWLGYNGLIISYSLQVIFLKRAYFNVHIHITYFTDTYHNDETRLLFEKTCQLNVKLPQP